MVYRKKISRKRNLKKVLEIAGLIVFLVSLFFLQKKIISHDSSAALSDQSASMPQQRLLLENLVADRKSGDRSLSATAHAYDFVSQYINNGGNIYDVYDTVRTTPELSFLEQAKAIYPDIFAQIESRQLPYTYSDRGMYAYLAYLQVLRESGYDGITITGPLAFNYSRMAYYMKMVQTEKAKGNLEIYPNYDDSEIDRNSAKAKQYIEEGKGYAQQILKEGDISKDLASVPSVFGLVQYAVALRYAETLHILDRDSLAKDIFSFVASYAQKGGLPEMYLPVALYDATSLLRLDNVTEGEIRRALAPVLASPSASKVPVIQAVLDARYKKNVPAFSELETTSFKSLKTLGIRVPEFKTWLLSKGWQESDF